MRIEPSTTRSKLNSNALTNCAMGAIFCDDVCMCVVNKQFELLEFVSESVYVDLQYDEISLTFTAGSVCLCGVSIVVQW